MSGRNARLGVLVGSRPFRPHRLLPDVDSVHPLDGTHVWNAYLVRESPSNQPYSVNG